MPPIVQIKTPAVVIILRIVGAGPIDGELKVLEQRGVGVMRRGNRTACYAAQLGIEQMSHLAAGTVVTG
ncbi:MAG: hypothetical protein KJ958_06775 [Gammaproteobacteria bacterium]|nr:hypothetical protein [Gammaproteobacteria bacterium]MBU1978860.1 hypothetical protein [Gammaproteobacteria bacterium]